MITYSTLHIYNILRADAAYVAFLNELSMVIQILSSNGENINVTVNVLDKYQST